MSIRFESVSKVFGEHILFEDLNLEIKTGATIVFTGRSGCGKTTMLRMIAGLDKDYSGTITGVPDAVSFLFQEDRLLPWYNVKQNIEFVLRDMMSREKSAETIRSILNDVQLTGHEHKLPQALSGGMQRRAAMARAFCYPSDLLLMDEPFKGFDKKLNNVLFELFERLYTNSGKTVLIVSHDHWLIERLSCDVIDIASL